MKSILIIGMGRFGQHLCRNLAALDNEIMIVDQEEERLEDMLPLVVSAKIGDCTNETVLRSLGVANFDLCFVCIGTNFQSSLEITSMVKELGAKYVVSKANRDIHRKVISRRGLLLRRKGSSLSVADCCFFVPCIVRQFQTV